MSRLGNQEPTLKSRMVLIYRRAFKFVPHCRRRPIYDQYWRTNHLPGPQIPFLSRLRVPAGLLTGVDGRTRRRLPST